jgi:hypothetical protein
MSTKICVVRAQLCNSFCEVVCSVKPPYFADEVTYAAMLSTQNNRHWSAHNHRPIHATTGGVT